MAGRVGRVAVLFVLATTGCTATPSKPPAEPWIQDIVAKEGPAAPDKVLTERVSVTRDKVDGITWYRHQRWWTHDRKGTPQSSTMELCIRDISNVISSVLVFHCYSDNWLQFEKLTVVADGQRFERSVFQDVKQDYISTGEFFVMCQIAPAPLDDLRMVKAVADSKDAIIRFRGARGQVDYTFTAADRTVLKDMLAAFRQLAPWHPAWKEAWANPQ